MNFFDPLVVWIHLVFSSIWVGGSIFLGLVLAPLLKKTMPDLNKRISFMVIVGRRFNYLGGSSLLILVITGIYNARSFIGQPSLLFESTYGYILLAKIILVCILFIIYIIHVLILNKNVEKQILERQVPNEYFTSLRSKIILLGRVTVGLSIAILYLAALLDRGVPGWT
jgi:putative copper resistance protein D